VHALRQSGIEVSFSLPVSNSPSSRLFPAMTAPVAWPSLADGVHRVGAVSVAVPFFGLVERVRVVLLVSTVSLCFEFPLHKRIPIPATAGEIACHCHSQHQSAPPPSVSRAAALVESAIAQSLAWSENGLFPEPLPFLAVLGLRPIPVADTNGRLPAYWRLP